MYIAEVVGNVVSTKKDESLVGYKLMMIQRIGLNKVPIGGLEVAADYVGCGIGEYVLVGKGSAARVGKKDAAIDMAIIGIIDNMDA